MRRVLTFVALSMVAVSASASAQHSSNSGNSSSASNMPIELGFDAGLSSELSGTNKTTALSAPLQQIRAGWFMSPTISIEPTFRLITGSTSGVANSNFTAYGVGAGVLYHLSASRAANQWYVRPFVGFDGAKAGTASASAFSFGGGVGIKMPMQNRFASRFEANMTRTAGQNGAAAMNSMNLLAGLSVYSH